MLFGKLPVGLFSYPEIAPEILVSDPQTALKLAPAHHATVPLNTPCKAVFLNNFRAAMKAVLYSLPLKYLKGKTISKLQPFSPLQMSISPDLCRNRAAICVLSHGEKILTGR